MLGIPVPILHSGLPEPVRTRHGWYRAVPQVCAVGEISMLGGEVGSSGHGRPSAWRAFDAWSLCVILDGQGTYRDAAGAAVAISPGSVLCFRPRLGHAYQPDPGSSFAAYFVIARGPLCEWWHDRGLWPARPVVAVDPRPFVRDLQAAAEGHHQGPDPALSRLSAFLGLAARLAGTRPSASAWLDEARAVLLATPPGRLDGPAVARRCGCSWETFRKRFRAATGEPPGRWRMRARLGQAAVLLRATGRNLAEIAAELGFADAFHLSRSFRAAYGMAPARWRRGGQAITSPPRAAARTPLA